MARRSGMRRYKSVIEWLIILVAVGGLLCGVWLVCTAAQGQEISNANGEAETAEPASEIVIEHVEYDLVGNENSGKSKLFQHYLDTSEDVIARLYIPGTTMETPVVVGDFYYRRNLSGNYDVNGTPFVTDTDQFMQPNMNAVIYGHRLVEREDFGMLREYLDQEFYDEHKEIYLETVAGTTRWKIISVFTINLEYGQFNYPEYTDLTESTRLNTFLNEVRTRSEVQTDEYSYESGDQFITLSTCHYETDREYGRLAVVAVKER